MLATQSAENTQGKEEVRREGGRHERGEACRTFHTGTPLQTHNNSEQDAECVRRQVAPETADISPHLGPDVLERGRADQRETYQEHVLHGGGGLEGGERWTNKVNSAQTERVR